MLTNPNTLGLFEEEIDAIAAAVHEVGGLLYYDGANLNAILGVVRPGDMGFDIVHLNLHKTFATPARRRGTRRGPRRGVRARSAEFLPGPRPQPRPTDGAFEWTTPPRSIGRVHSWHGNALVLARAHAYLRLHGADGLRRVAERAVLNANWLRVRLLDTYPAAFDRPCMHEVVLTAAGSSDETACAPSTSAKRLLEEGFHAPTVYFPLVVDEALMVEPTETESPQTLVALAEAFERIAADGGATPTRAHDAPMHDAGATRSTRRVPRARSIATEDDRTG